MSCLSSEATKSKFCDVNLVCEDNERVGAHQLILSSSSTFLKTLLLQHRQNLTGEKPTIIIPDIAREDLEDLLQFTYHGSLKMKEIKFQNFVNLTKFLGVKNLKKQSKKGVRSQPVKSVIPQKSFVKLDKMNMMSFPSTSREKVLNEKEENDTMDYNEHLDLHEEDYDHADKSEEIESPGKEVNKESPKKTKFNIDPEKAKIRYKKMFGSFLCPYCAQIFTLKKSLKNHIQNIHDGIRYQCDQCPYQAANKTGLKRHIEGRHEGNTFYCDQCDHSSSSRFTLATHMQNMHSDTVWKCDDCDYKTKQKPNLKKHRDAKHDNIRYTCEICMKSLSQKGQLKVHMKKFHGIDQRKYQTINALNNT